VQRAAKGLVRLWVRGGRIGHEGDVGDRGESRAHEGELGELDHLLAIVMVLREQT
jgi:hypothetical protein